MKKLLCMCLTLLVIFNSLTLVNAAESSARTIVVFRTEGKNVSMTKGTAKEFSVKEGMKLSDGYTVSTGAGSFVYLKLDSDTILKMDEKSKISISKASSTKLSLSVLSGTVAVDAAPQKEGDTLEVRAGNTALAVRGTSFAIKIGDDGESLFFMFEGSGDVGGFKLDAGKMIKSGDLGKLLADPTNDIKISDGMGVFILQMILEHSENLINIGAIKPEDIGIIQEIITQIEQGGLSNPNSVTSPNTPGTQSRGSNSTSQNDISGFNYYINYRLNDGTDKHIRKGPYRSGEQISLPEWEALREYMNEEFIFEKIALGWNTNAVGDGTKYGFGQAYTMPAHDVTLYLEWGRANVAYIGETGYTSVSAALEAAQYGDIVQIVKTSAIHENEEVTVKAGVILRIGYEDNSYHNYALNNDGDRFAYRYMVNNYGKITVEETGAIEVYSYLSNKNAINNQGNIKIFGLLQCSGAFNTESNGTVTIEEDGSADIIGVSTFTVVDGGSFINYGTIWMYSGTFEVKAPERFYNYKDMMVYGGRVTIHDGYKLMGSNGAKVSVYHGAIITYLLSNFSDIGTHIDADTSNGYMVIHGLVFDWSDDLHENNSGESGWLLANFNAQANMLSVDDAPELQVDVME